MLVVFFLDMLDITCFSWFILAIFNKKLDSYCKNIPNFLPEEIQFNPAIHPIQKIESIN